VVEILKFYAQLRGLSNISYHVDKIIDAVGIERFRDRMASKLSGGNKRKLSLGIALIGDPSVLLLDEPSSGMDAFAKRIMWKTLARVSHGRSIVLTTHSMEEADALASRAGILAKKMLTVGSTELLRNIHGKAYHVHIVCRSAPSTSHDEMMSLVSWIQQQLPGAEVGDRLYQGQIKMSIPVHGNIKVSDIFKLFEHYKEELGIESYSVASTTLEEVFLRIVGEHNIAEEGYEKAQEPMNQSQPPKPMH
jgi:ATP-binding cassette subfamily A (ABC1) protein 3